MQLTQFNDDILTHIAGHLPFDNILTFSQTCRRFAAITHQDSTWREMLWNHFGVTYKLPKETWREMYERKVDDPKNHRICPHVGWIDDRVLRPYEARYQQVLQWLPKNLNCRTCGKNQSEEGLCLYIWYGNVRLRCRSCANRFHAMAPRRYGIMLRMNVLQMYCFCCSRLLGETRGDASEANHVDALLKTLTQGSSLGQEAWKRRNQCLNERVMHAEESDRAYILKSRYYLVDRVWLCSWFLRLCDGKIGVGPVNNDALTEDGRLNPLARPRGGFLGGFGIVTPRLWHYFMDTYGLSGSTYTSDDIHGSDYHELRQAINDWKLI